MANYLVHKTTGRQYRIVSIDTQNGTITLEGERTTFTEKFDKEQFKRMGYDLVRDVAPELKGEKHAVK